MQRFRLFCRRPNRWEELRQLRMKTHQSIEPTSLLDPALYESARQARDPRYDGRFYVGVLTTGIYCRPVCPVRVPKQENILLYRSAAAASAAGFHPVCAAVQSPLPERRHGVAGRGKSLEHSR